MSQQIRCDICQEIIPKERRMELGTDQSFIRKVTLNNKKLTIRFDVGPTSVSSKTRPDVDDICEDCAKKAIKIASEKLETLKENS